MAQVATIQKEMGIVMSDDAAIEAEVAVLVQDAKALKAAFDKLAAEVAAGQPLNPQTLTDLANAVGAVTATLPPAPTP
jgi:hypothetical protein